MNVKSDEFYESLSPGIRRLVRLLHEWGYETTDSGDGTNAKEGLECSVPYPMVVIELPEWGSGIEREADHLWERLDKAGVVMGENTEIGPRKVEASYEVGGPRLLLVLHVTDEDLK